MVSVQAARGSGQWITFTKNQSKWVAPAGISDGLIKIPTGWLYLNHGENKYEVYDNEGALVVASRVIMYPFEAGHCSKQGT